MANKSKIFGELEQNVREMILAGYNAYFISKKIGVSKETVKSWAIKNGIEITKNTNPDEEIRKNKFISLIKDGMALTQARKELGLGSGTVQKIINDNNLRYFVRDRAKAALDKILTLTEATDRLPEGSGVVIDYDQSKNKYLVKALDGFLYYKKSSKLYQGDPRGKCGTKTDISVMISELLSIGYEVLDGTFVKKRKAMKAIHLKCGNVREARYKNFFLQNCPVCANTGTSKEELSLKDYIESLGFETEKYKFKERVTRPKEIDIMVKMGDSKIGFEYCGIYDHNECSRCPRPRGYHLDKMVEFKKDSGRLITIYDSEWNNRNYQIKSFIKSLLNKNERIIPGRSCEVKEIDSLLGIEFLEINHIQGTGKSEFYNGLFFGNELVGVVGFSKHHRANSNESIVLNRLCFKSNVTILGGASKLLEHSKDQIKKRGYSSIISWSNNRWSEGNIYNKLGFTMEEESDPDYDYVKGNKLYSKQSLKLTEEEKGLNIPESELRKSQGYSRIWDCGKKRWILKLI